MGTPNPLGEAYVRPVFITQDRKPKAQGAWVGIRCRGGNETSGVRADHGGCSREAEHLTMRGSKTAGGKSTQERRTSYTWVQADILGVTPMHKGSALK